ncbi:MAG: hypothetical protein UX13_C0005G0003 [Candidatus Woesebacteria bacterium GW2011_GWB1_45_5]|uniref:Uncharacterized protein n=1 Tax=Candidatus Woesebacteria bacterium GW2011_GWB1_45_5 TaxID=1618581 RepID=A0A0G1QQ01_9BACT|nr:MAG: hypothetical protein UX13_C0005G0003 [Candidatus Woesebacteria bacterium GW2011_GWB1_45_5]
MNGQSIPTGIEQPQPPVELPVQRTRIINIPPKIKEAWNKFYSNKKIFWPIMIVSGLLLVTLVAGILFGTGKADIKIGKPGTTPTVSAVPEATESTDPLTIINVKLLDLGTQIKEMDVRQSRLSPPSVNFDIAF